MVLLRGDKSARRLHTNSGREFGFAARPDENLVAFSSKPELLGDIRRKDSPIVCSRETERLLTLCCKEDWKGSSGSRPQNSMPSAGSVRSRGCAISKAVQRVSRKYWRTVEEAGKERRSGPRVCFRAGRRTIERKKARSGPEDKCLPTQSRAFYQGSRSSRFTERKSAKRGVRGEREGEGGPGRVASRWHNWPAKMQVHVHVVCTDSPRLGSTRLVEAPAADRDRGLSGSGLRSKTLHERALVCRCNWSLAVWSVRWLAGAYLRIQLAIHPPFAKDRPGSHLFSPCRFICNLKRASIAQCVPPTTYPATYRPDP